MQAQNDFVLTLIEEAKTWIGTPYIENLGIKNLGADCAGFLIGTFKNCGINHSFREIGLEASLERYFAPRKSAQIGDILLFKSENNNLKHLGILISNTKIIHAHWGAGIVENSYGNWFKSRLIAAYKYVG